MALELPSGLEWLKYIVGMEWPHGNEDDMWAMAGDWATAADGLREILDDIDAAKAAALKAYPVGDGVDDMITAFDSMRTGDQSLEKLAEFFDQVGETVNSTGTEIEYTKLMFYSSLALLAAEIIAAWIFPPTAPAIEALAISITRVVVRLIGERAAAWIIRNVARFAATKIVSFMARHVLIDTVLGTMQELMIQQYQVDKGHRKEIDWKQVGSTMVSSAAGGAAAGPFGGWLGNRLGAEMKPMLKGAITGVGAGIMGTIGGMGGQFAWDVADGGLDQALNNLGNALTDPLQWSAGVTNGAMSGANSAAANAAWNKMNPGLFNRPAFEPRLAGLFGPDANLGGFGRDGGTGDGDGEGDGSANRPDDGSGAQNRGDNRSDDGTLNTGEGGTGDQSMRPAGSTDNTGEAEGDNTPARGENDGRAQQSEDNTGQGGGGGTRQEGRAEGQTDAGGRSEGGARADGGGQADRSTDTGASQSDSAPQSRAEVSEGASSAATSGEHGSRMDTTSSDSTSTRDTNVAPVAAQQGAPQTTNAPQNTNAPGQSPAQQTNTPGQQGQSPATGQQANTTPQQSNSPADRSQPTNSPSDTRQPNAAPARAAGPEIRAGVDAAQPRAGAPDARTTVAGDGSTARPSVASRAEVAGIADTTRSNEHSGVRAEHAATEAPRAVTTDTTATQDVRSEAAEPVSDRNRADVDAEAVPPVVPIATPDAPSGRRAEPAGQNRNRDTGDDRGSDDQRDQSDDLGKRDRPEDTRDQWRDSEGNLPVYDDFLPNGEGVVHRPHSTSIGDDPATHNVRENLLNEGEHDVILHGSADGSPIPGNRIPTHPEQIVQAILNNPDYQPGTPIRLMSCHSGNSAGWAQYVSDRLGVTVRAPDGVVGTEPVPGSPAIFKNPTTKWQTFEPAADMRVNPGDSRDAIPALRPDNDFSPDTEWRHGLGDLVSAGDRSDPNSMWMGDDGPPPSSYLQPSPGTDGVPPQLNGDGDMVQRLGELSLDDPRVQVEGDPPAITSVDGIPIDEYSDRLTNERALQFAEQGARYTELSKEVAAAAKVRETAEKALKSADKAVSNADGTLRKAASNLDEALAGGDQSRIDTATEAHERAVTRSDAANRAQEAAFDRFHDAANAEAARRDLLAAALADGTAHNPKTRGTVTSITIDRLTGRVYEGANGFENRIPVSDLQPAIVDNIRRTGADPDELFAAPQGDHDRLAYPHYGSPIEHAEVRGTNMALQDRAADNERAGRELYPTGRDGLDSILNTPYYPEGTPGNRESTGPTPSPCCANCSRTVAGTESTAGHLRGHDGAHPTGAVADGDTRRHVVSPFPPDSNMAHVVPDTNGSAATPSQDPHRIGQLTPAATRVTDGVITEINGRSPDDFTRDLARNRAAEHEEVKRDLVKAATDNLAKKLPALEAAQRKFDDADEAHRAKPTKGTESSRDGHQNKLDNAQREVDAAQAALDAVNATFGRNGSHIAIVVDPVSGRVYEAAVGDRTPEQVTAQLRELALSERTPEQSRLDPDGDALHSATHDSEAGPFHESGGARRPAQMFDDDLQSAWAAEAYDLFRATDGDIDAMVRALADVERGDGSTGFTRAEIEQVKRHLFIEEHPLTAYDDDGNAIGLVNRRYDADADIAEAWMRMALGTARPDDIVLLEHEVAESNYYRDNPGASYRQAHEFANESFNWESLHPVPRSGENLNNWRSEFGDVPEVPTSVGDPDGGDLPVRGSGEPGPLPDNSAAGLPRESGGRADGPDGDQGRGESDNPAPQGRDLDQSRQSSGLDDSPQWMGEDEPDQPSHGGEQREVRVRVGDDGEIVSLHVRLEDGRWVVAEAADLPQTPADSDEQAPKRGRLRQLVDMLNDGYQGLNLKYPSGSGIDGLGQTALRDGVTDAPVLFDPPQQQPQPVSPPPDGPELRPPPEGAGDPALNVARIGKEGATVWQNREDLPLVGRFMGRMQDVAGEYHPVMNPDGSEYRPWITEADPLAVRDQVISDMRAQRLDRDEARAILEELFGVADAELRQELIDSLEFNNLVDFDEARALEEAPPYDPARPELDGPPPEGESLTDMADRLGFRLDDESPEALRRAITEQTHRVLREVSEIAGLAAAAARADEEQSRPYLRPDQSLDEPGTNALDTVPDGIDPRSTELDEYDGLFGPDEPRPTLFGDTSSPRAVPFADEVSFDDKNPMGRFLRDLVVAFEGRTVLRDYDGIANGADQLPEWGNIADAIELGRDQGTPAYFENALRRDQLRDELSSWATMLGADLTQLGGADLDRTIGDLRAAAQQRAQDLAAFIAAAEPVLRADTDEPISHAYNDQVARLPGPDGQPDRLVVTDGPLDRAQALARVLDANPDVAQRLRDGELTLDFRETRSDADGNVHLDPVPTPQVHHIDSTIAGAEVKVTMVRDGDGQWHPVQADPAPPPLTRQEMRAEIDRLAGELDLRPAQMHPAALGPALDSLAIDNAVRAGQIEALADYTRQMREIETFNAVSDARGQLAARLRLSEADFTPRRVAEALVKRWVRNPTRDQQFEDLLDGPRHEPADNQGYSRQLREIDADAVHAAQNRLLEALGVRDTESMRPREYKTDPATKKLVGYGPAETGIDPHKLRKRIMRMQRQGQGDQVRQALADYVEALLAIDRYSDVPKGDHRNDPRTTGEPDVYDIDGMDTMRAAVRAALPGGDVLDFGRLVAEHASRASDADQPVDPNSPRPQPNQDWARLIGVDVSEAGSQQVAQVLQDYLDAYEASLGGDAGRYAGLSPEELAAEVDRLRADLQAKATRFNDVYEAYRDGKIEKHEGPNPEDFAAELDRLRDEVRTRAQQITELRALADAYDRSTPEPDPAAATREDIPLPAGATREDIPLPAAATREDIPLPGAATREDNPLPGAAETRTDLPSNGQATVRDPLPQGADDTRPDITERGSELDARADARLDETMRALDETAADLDRPMATLDELVGPADPVDPLSAIDEAFRRQDALSEESFARRKAEADAANAELIDHLTARGEDLAAQETYLRAQREFDAAYSEIADRFSELMQRASEHAGVPQDSSRSDDGDDSGNDSTRDDDGPEEPGPQPANPGGPPQKPPADHPAAPMPDPEEPNGRPEGEPVSAIEESPQNGDDPDAAAIERAQALLDSAKAEASRSDDGNRDDDGPEEQGPQPARPSGPPGKPPAGEILTLTPEAEQPSRRTAADLFPLPPEPAELAVRETPETDVPPTPDDTADPREVGTPALDDVAKFLRELGDLPPSATTDVTPLNDVAREHVRRLAEALGLGDLLTGLADPLGALAELADLARARGFLDSALDPDAELGQPMRYPDDYDALDLDELQDGRDQWQFEGDPEVRARIAEELRDAGLDDGTRNELTPESEPDPAERPMRPAGVLPPTDGPGQHPSTPRVEPAQQAAERLAARFGIDPADTAAVDANRYRNILRAGTIEAFAETARRFHEATDPRERAQLEASARRWAARLGLAPDPGLTRAADDVTRLRAGVARDAADLAHLTHLNAVELDERHLSIEVDGERILVRLVDDGPDSWHVELVERPAPEPTPAPTVVKAPEKPKSWLRRLWDKINVGYQGLNPKYPSGSSVDSAGLSLLGNQAGLPLTTTKDPTPGGPIGDEYELLGVKFNPARWIIEGDKFWKNRELVPILRHLSSRIADQAGEFLPVRNLDGTEYRPWITDADPELRRQIEQELRAAGLDHLIDSDTPELTDGSETTQREQLPAADETSVEPAEQLPPWAQEVVDAVRQRLIDAAALEALAGELGIRLTDFTDAGLRDAVAEGEYRLLRRDGVIRGLDVSARGFNEEHARIPFLPSSYSGQDPLGSFLKEVVDANGGDTSILNWRGVNNGGEWVSAWDSLEAEEQPGRDQGLRKYLENAVRRSGLRDERSTWAHLSGADLDALVADVDAVLNSMREQLTRNGGVLDEFTRRAAEFTDSDFGDRVIVDTENGRIAIIDTGMGPEQALARALADADADFIDRVNRGEVEIDIRAVSVDPAGRVQIVELDAPDVRHVRTEVDGRTVDATLLRRGIEPWQLVELPPTTPEPATGLAVAEQPNTPVGDPRSAVEILADIDAVAQRLGIDNPVGMPADDLRTLISDLERANHVRARQVEGLLDFALSTDTIDTFNDLHTARNALALRALVEAGALTPEVVADTIGDPGTGTALRRQQVKDLLAYVKLLSGIDADAVTAARDALAPHLGLPRGALPTNADALHDAIVNRMNRVTRTDLTTPLTDFVRALGAIDPYTDGLIYDPATDPRAVSDDPPVHQRDALDFLREVGATDLSDTRPLPTDPDALPGPSRDYARLLGLDLTDADPAQFAKAYESFRDGRIDKHERLTTDQLAETHAQIRDEIRARAADIAALRALLDEPHAPTPEMSAPSAPGLPSPSNPTRPEGLPLPGPNAPDGGPSPDATRPDGLPMPDPTQPDADPDDPDADGQQLAPAGPPSKPPSSPPTALTPEPDPESRDNDHTPSRSTEPVDRQVWPPVDNPDPTLRTLDEIATQLDRPLASLDDLVAPADPDNVHTETPDPTPVDPLAVGDVDSTRIDGAEESPGAEPRGDTSARVDHAERAAATPTRPAAAHPAETVRPDSPAVAQPRTESAVAEKNSRPDDEQGQRPAPAGPPSNPPADPTTALTPEPEEPRRPSHDHKTAPTTSATKTIADLTEHPGGVVRDADGLITEVDGKPVQEHTDAVARDRAGRFRDAAKSFAPREGESQKQATKRVLAAQKNGTHVSDKSHGKVTAAVVDRRTGTVYEGTNGRRDDVVPKSRRHPALRERVEAMEAEGRALADGGYPALDRNGRPEASPEGSPAGTRPHPHFDNPWGHAEVKALNEALHARDRENERRQANGEPLLPAGADALREMYAQTYKPFDGKDPVPTPFCANCHHTMGDVGCHSGRYSGYPQTPENLVDVYQPDTDQPADRTPSENDHPAERPVNTAETPPPVARSESVPVPVTSSDPVRQEQDSESSDPVNSSTAESVPEQVPPPEVGDSGETTADPDAPSVDVAFSLDSGDDRDGRPDAGERTHRTDDANGSTTDDRGGDDRGGDDPGDGSGGDENGDRDRDGDDPDRARVIPDEPRYPQLPGHRMRSHIPHPPHEYEVDLVVPLFDPIKWPTMNVDGSEPADPHRPPQPTHPQQPGQPSHPPQPGHPGQPSHPPMPTHPPQPTHPPMPSHPPQPSHPPMPSYPPQPTYPPMPSYPPAPTYPTPTYPTPSVPTYPTPTPSAPSYPNPSYPPGTPTYPNPADPSASPSYPNPSGPGGPGSGTPGSLPPSGTHGPGANSAPGFPNGAYQPGTHPYPGANGPWPTPTPTDPNAGMYPPGAPMGPMGGPMGGAPGGNGGGRSGNANRYRPDQGNSEPTDAVIVRPFAGYGVPAQFDPHSGGLHPAPPDATSAAGVYADLGETPVVFYRGRDGLVLRAGLQSFHLDGPVDIVWERSAQRLTRFAVTMAGQIQCELVYRSLPQELDLGLLVRDVAADPNRRATIFR
ncbi:hypothetical protein ACFWPX_20215 [Nocardia sp. NPDC058518]|uniref:WXG100-like domain-containing protein n=1 Tax=Nocardia sp. NPDC058518 TaxID=3346534 RepID=UPI00365D2044